MRSCERDAGSVLSSVQGGGGGVACTRPAVRVLFRACLYRGSSVAGEKIVQRVLDSGV